MQDQSLGQSFGQDPRQVLHQKNGLTVSAERFVPGLAGFTFLEILVVLVIIGVLFAIAAPSCLRSLQIQRLNIAQDEIFQAMRMAQYSAKLNRVVWQVSFRQVNETVQWVIHPATTLPTETQWTSLDPSIRLDAETTLQAVGGIRRLQFNQLGRVNGQLGRITLSSSMGGSVKRCVIASTLLGVLRKAADHTRPSNGKYCY